MTKVIPVTSIYTYTFQPWGIKEDLEKKCLQLKKSFFIISAKNIYHCEAYSFEVIL